MANEAQISTFLNAQLNNDSRAQLIAAGDNWTTLAFSFFYSTDVSVHLGVRATMLRVLEQEHAILPPEGWAALDQINLNTQVSEAITTIAEISLSAVSQVRPS